VSGVISHQSRDARITIFAEESILASNALKFQTNDFPEFTPDECMWLAEEWHVRCGTEENLQQEDEDKCNWADMNGGRADLHPIDGHPSFVVRLV
jgi:hypothetical protein